MKTNIANDLLRGFNAGEAHKDRARRRGIETESLAMGREMHELGVSNQRQRSRINEIQIKDERRGQLKQRASDDFKVLQHTGELPAPETYGEYKEAGMAHFSPWHYSDENRVKSLTQLKPVLDSIAKGRPEDVNTPDNLRALNAVLSDEVNVNIGEPKPELGGNVARKEISEFEVLPDSGGKIAVRLKVTLDNGTSYEEPMTVGRNAAQGAPVKVLDARTLIDDVMNRYQIGKFYSSPRGRQVIQSMQSILSPHVTSKSKAFAPITIVSSETGEKRIVTPTYNPETGLSSLSPLDMPEGFEISKETAGEKRAADVIFAGEKTKAVADAKTQASKEASKDVQKSKINDLDIIYKDLMSGDFDKIYGRGEGLYNGYLRSQEGIDLLARRDQLVSMLTLASRGELKGQGTITDGEQAMVANAVTILGNPEISPELARRSLDEAMGVLYRSAGLEFRPPVNSKGWKLMIDASGNRAYVGPNNEVEEI